MPEPAPIEPLEPHSDAEIARLASEAEGCRRCPLYRDATQAVFGEGPARAAVMLVGEQPGDQEDLAGHPFVGPAGKILDRALAEAGMDRKAIFVTNAVKHFKHELRGKRRLHKKPNQMEVRACRWWLDRELAVVRPKLVIALGATAAQALAGRAITLSKERGQVLTFPGELRGMVTIHPSAVLRMPDEEARREAFAGLVADLTRAVELVAGRARFPEPASSAAKATRAVAKRSGAATRPR